MLKAAAYLLMLHTLLYIFDLLPALEVLSQSRHFHIAQIEYFLHSYRCYPKYKYDPAK